MYGAHAGRAEEIIDNGGSASLLSFDLARVNRLRTNMEVSGYP